MCTVHNKQNQKHPTFKTTKIIFIYRKTSSHNSYKYSQLNAFTSSSTIEWSTNSTRATNNGRKKKKKIRDKNSEKFD